MYKIGYVALLAICIAFLSRVEAKTKTLLRQPKGNFSSPRLPNQAIEHEFVIRAKKERKISLKINQFDLDPRNSDFVSIRDGHRSTVFYVYTRQLGHIHLRIEDQLRSGSEERVVEEPVLFHAATRRLFVTYYTTNSTNRIGFTGSYETYPSWLCRVSSLDTYDPTPTCDRYDIAPVATRCSHDMKCPENHEPIGQAVCKQGGWVDNTKCLPNATIVNLCQMEQTEITHCPLTAQDLAKYYFELAGNPESFEQPLGLARSWSKGFVCPAYICKQTGSKYCKNSFAAYPNVVQLCLVCQNHICPKPKLNVFASD